MPRLAYQANTDGGSAADPAAAGEPALSEDVGDVARPVAVPQAVASSSVSAAAPPSRCSRRAVPAPALVTGTRTARARRREVGGSVAASASSASAGHTVTQSSGSRRLSGGEAKVSATPERLAVRSQRPPPREGQAPALPVRRQHEPQPRPCRCPVPDRHGDVPAGRRPASRCCSARACRTYHRRNLGALDRHRWP